MALEGRGLGLLAEVKGVFFFFFGQILCKIYDEEICKILTIKKKKKRKNHRMLDRTLALAYKAEVCKSSWAMAYKVPRSKFMSLTHYKKTP